MAKKESGTKRQQKRSSGAANSTWRDYEALAHKIIAELMPYAQVIRDDKIIGSETEQRRQIDVSARWSYEGVEQLLIVQVKEHSRPAIVGVVGAFLSDMRDVGANRGVLICSGGFTGGAKNWARNRGIDLYSLHDASSRTWSRELKIPFLWIEYEVDFASRYEFRAVETSTLTIRRDAPLRNAEGGGFSPMMHLVIGLWNDGTLSKDQGNHVYEAPGRWELKASDSLGRERTITDGLVRVRYRVRRRAWLAQYEPAECRGLFDYLDGEVFIPSYMSLADLPVQRDASWMEIDDPDAVALRARGVLITADLSHLDPTRGTLSTLKISEVTGGGERPIAGL